jgi:hypothetical protein
VLLQIPASPAALNYTYQINRQNDGTEKLMSNILMGRANNVLEGYWSVIFLLSSFLQYWGWKSEPCTC